MLPVGHEAFLAELRSLSPEERAAFLAALQEARGRRVERDGTRVRVGGPDGRTLVVALDGDGKRDRSGKGEDEATEAVDAAALRRAALYAIDRGDCERLFERFFGRSLSSFEGTDARPADPGVEPGPEGGDTDGGENGKTGCRTPVAGTGGTTGGSEPSPAEAGRDAPAPGGGASRADADGNGEEAPADDARRTARAQRWRSYALPAGVVLAVAAVLAVGLVAGGALPLGTGAAGDGTDGTANGSGVGAPAEENPNGSVAAAAVLGDTEDDAVPASVAPRSEWQLPPGVSPSGSVEEAELAAAHLDSLANRSFRLTLTYRETRDGQTVGVHREVLRVENATRYRVDVAETGRFETAPVTLSGADVYASGSGTGVATGGADADGRSGGMSYSAPGGGSGRVPYGDAIDRYLRWYLSVETSMLTDRTEVDGRSAYWLTIDGDPWPGVANTTGSTLIAENGTVLDLRRAYDDPDDPRVSVVVTLRVTDVGSTTVDRPAWYEGDGNATGTADPG